MDMQSTVMKTVVSTPELLETILLHLDMTTLLVSAQRVSRQWMSVIRASPKIQQALFFRSISSPSETLQFCLSSSEDDYVYVNEVFHSQNSLLVKHFGSVFFSRNGRGRFFYCHADVFTDLPWWAHAATNGEIDAEAALRRWRFIQTGAS